MNQAYMNQPPGSGMYGQPGPGPYQPSFPPSVRPMQNGPASGPPGSMKPPGPPGPPGPPKQGMAPSQPMSGGPVQNGFNSSGAQGDPYSANKSGFPPGQPGMPGPPRQPYTVPNTYQPPANDPSQLTNQMNQMSLGQPRPGPPMNSATPPPNQFGPPTGATPPPTRPPGESPHPGFPGMPPRPNMPPGGQRPNMPPMPPRPGAPLSTAPPRPGAPPSGAFQGQSQPGVPPPGPNFSNMPPRPGMPPTGHLQSNVPPTSGGMSPSVSGTPPPGTPTSVSGMPPTRPGVPPSSRPGQPPTGFPPMPPTSQIGAPGFPPTGSPGMAQMNSPGMPPTSQPGMPPMPGMPPTSQPGMPPMPGMPPTSQPGMPPMPGMPPTSQPGMPPMPGMPPTSQPGMPPMPGMPPTSQPGMPPMPGMPPSSHSGMPPMPGFPPLSSSGMPPTSQSGMPPMPGMSPGQPGMPPMPPSSQAGMAPMPGMPPMPPAPGMAQSQMPPGGPGQNYQNQRPMAAPPQAPRRLDPDQMPSPIQVIEDDRKNRSGVYNCNAKGQMPPLVTTDIVAVDQGHCSPRFIRSTMYNLPCSNDIVKQCHIPMALTISPMARLGENERPPPVVNLGELGPVRCNRCKAYMNPNMTFIDGGRRFQCCFCACTTEVPAEYFAHLDHTGRRVDAYERPELCLASYEFVATKEYCKNNVFPKPPAFIFMIDVSYNAVKSGLVHLLCERLKNDILLNLPREAGMEESEIRVGFATYTNVIHFYNVKGCLVQPQMMVVADVEDMFVPLVDGFLVTLAESEAVIDCLLEQIPVLWGESRDTETILGPVIQAGLDALKSADCSGKLFIFHSSLPTADAPGKLKMRDDRKLLGSDKEKSILSPSNNFYSKLAKECVAAGCGVDMFLFPNSYTDVATISEVCKTTGGQVYKYTYFRADVDGDRFVEDLRMDVQRQIGFDAVMRVRTSTGIRPVDFMGNFYMSNTTDIELAVIDSDKAVTVELKHDDKLNEAEGAFIQAAILYTSITGQRRLRVHNLALNCCTQLADLFRNVETDVLINALAKKAIRDVLQHNPRAVRENITNLCANILACYRKNCASPSSAGQLILPECMKLLPLYSNCLIKSDALQGAADVSTDDRSYLMHLVNAMSVSASCIFFYPRLLPLHELDVSSNQLPLAVRCSNERLVEHGAYLLENGISMFLWLGHNIDPEWVHDVFGVQSAAQIDIDKGELLALDNPLSLRLRNIITQIRKQRGRWMKLTIVRQRDKLEPWFHHFLVEDRGQNGTTSYVEFLCHIHKEIRNLLS